MSVFFRDLHALTRSGIDIAAACREVQRRGPVGLRGLAREMADAAEAGDPISSALERHRDLFYPWHLGIVRAAEAGAFLPEAFDQIATAYEDEWETRGALRLRLFIYLFFGLPAALVAIPFIRLFGADIPDEGWNLQLALHEVWFQFQTVSLPILVGILALILIWQALTSTAWFQGIQQRIVLHLPVVGRLARATALERYLATLGLMLRGGLPLGEAAEQSAMAAGHVVLTPKLLGIVPALREGVPFSQALAGERLLDPDTLDMASTGEAAGALPDMLTRAATYYRKDNRGKRRILLRAAGIAVGIIWIIVAFSLLVMFVKAYYFDYIWRVEEWVME